MQRTIKTIWFHVRLIAVSFVFRGESIRKSIMCGPASVYTCVPKNICGTLCNIIQSFSYSCVICARTNGYTHRELHSLLFFPFNGCALRPSKQRSRCAACSLWWGNWQVSTMRLSSARAQQINTHPPSVWRNKHTYSIMQRAQKTLYDASL